MAFWSRERGSLLVASSIVHLPSIDSYYLANFDLEQKHNRRDDNKRVEHSSTI